MDKDFYSYLNSLNNTPANNTLGALKTFGTQPIPKPFK